MSYLDEPEFESRLSLVLPHLNSPELKPVQFAEMFARMSAVALARAEFLGALLAEQFEHYGIKALVGHRMAVIDDGDGQQHTEPLSEEVRALVMLEGQERDRAERLATQGIKLGIEAKRVDVMRSYGRTVAEAMRSFTVELGINWADPAVRRAAQRSVISARQNLGFSIDSPDRIGPRMSPEERQRMLVEGVSHDDSASPDTGLDGSLGDGTAG
jgi:hypothetical protein